MDALIIFGHIKLIGSIIQQAQVNLKWPGPENPKSGLDQWPWMGGSNHWCNVLWNSKRYPRFNWPGWNPILDHSTTTQDVCTNIQISGSAEINFTDLLDNAVQVSIYGENNTVTK